MQKLLIMIASCLFSVGAWAQFEGNGTENDPYLINNTSDLAELARQVNSGTTYEGQHFKLTTNLDLSDWDSGDGRGWIPIGYYHQVNEILEYTLRPFKGIFDGNHKIINGVTIDRYAEQGLGLFGYVYGGKIKNLGLTTVFVTGESHIGGLVGNARRSTIENCYATGQTNADYYYVGGLIGWAHDSGIIHDCYAICQTSGSEWVGGLVGWVYGSFESGQSLLNCYAITQAKGRSYVGGLVGKAQQTDINNCNAAGVVSGELNIGGLVGNGTYNCAIYNCYATGLVNGEQFVGGLVGLLDGYEASIRNSYTICQVDGIDDVGGLVGNASTIGRTEISNSIAANLRISGTSSVNRLVGSTGCVTQYNNYANATMLVNNKIQSDDLTTDSIICYEGINGIGKSLSVLRSADFYTNSSNWYEDKAWDLQVSHNETKTWNLWEGKSFPYFQRQAAPAIRTGADDFSGVYRTDDGQTTDSLVFYLNGVYHSRTSSPSDGKWAFRDALLEKDTLTVLVYEAEKSPSVTVITGVSNDVSNELIIQTNKVWPANGHVFIYVENSIPVQIYNLLGALVNATQVTAGETCSIALPAGIYIVKAGNQSYKVIVK